MKRVLLIGATSSVASNVARRYAAEGHRLFLLARNEEKLNRLREELAPQVIGWESYEFSQYRASEQVIGRAFEAADAFELVVIAHGFLGDQLLSESDFEEAERQIAVNYLSVVAQLIAITRHLEKLDLRKLAEKPQVAVLCSVAGDRGRPRNYTYGSAKGALSLYLQGLRSSRYGALDVTTIKLGPVDTPMTVDHPKNAFFSTSEDVADSIVKAIRKRRREVYVPGYWWWIMNLVTRLPEPLFQRISFLSGR